MNVSVKNKIASERVFATTRAIPAGSVATYADVARAIGKPRAWRRVGTVLGANRDPETPCHRVVRADGLVGGFGFPGGTAEKIRRLKREGVLVKDGRVDLARFRIYQAISVSGHSL